MASTPLFIGSGLATPVASITTQSTARDGTGSYTTIFTSPAGGAIVNGIRFICTSIVEMETYILLFSDDGTNVKLIDEIYVRNPVETSIGTTVWTLDWVPPQGPFIMPAADTLKAARYGGSGTINAWIRGGGLT